MARVKRPPFNPSGPFMARVSFPFNGVRYDVGEIFPHHDVKPRRLKLLYNARRINLATQKEVETEKASADWHDLGEEGILNYAFEQTGTRFRKVERAINALEDVC